MAATLTYTLVVLLTVLLARGAAHGPEAVVRTLLAGGIMIAPQLSAGVYAVGLAVGHIGTAVPLLLCWLTIDRGGRRWQVPLLTTLLLAWVLVADPLVEVVGIAPLVLVAGLSFTVWLARGQPRWFDAALAAAALGGYALALAAEAVLRALGGYAAAAVAPYLWMTDTTWYDPVRNTASFLILQRPPRPAHRGYLAPEPAAGPVRGQR